MQQIPFCRDFPSLWCFTFCPESNKLLSENCRKWGGWMERKKRRQNIGSHENTKLELKSSSFLMRTLRIKALLSLPQEGYTPYSIIICLEDRQTSIHFTLKVGSWISWVWEEEAQCCQLFFHWEKNPNIQGCQSIHFCFCKAANQLVTTAITTFLPAVSYARWELSQSVILRKCRKLKEEITAPWLDIKGIWLSVKKHFPCVINDSKRTSVFTIYMYIASKGRRFLLSFPVQGNEALLERLQT